MAILIDNLWLLGIVAGVLVLIMFFVYKLVIEVDDTDEDTEQDFAHAVSDLTSTLKSTYGPLPEKLVEVMRFTGIGHVPYVMEIWSQLSSEVKEQVVKFWENEGYAEQYLNTLEDLDEAGKENVIKFLRIMDSESAILAFMDSMGNKNEGTRMAATEVLRNLKDVRVIQPLINALNEPHKYLPARVAEVLISLGKDAVEPLINALFDLPEQVKGMVIEILEEIGDERATRALIKELTHESAEIRMKAASALGEIGNSEATESLLLLMKDSEWGVRAKAARSLGKIGSERAIPALREAINDEAWWVRTHAQEALENLTYVAEA